MIVFCCVLPASNKARDDDDDDDVTEQAMSLGMHYLFSLQLFSLFFFSYTVL